MSTQTRRVPKIGELTADQLNERSLLLDRLREKRRAVQRAIEAYNDAMEYHRDLAEAAVRAYNEEVDEAASFATDVAEELGKRFEARCENWQKSDEAKRFLDWVEAWRDLDLEHVVVDIPDALSEMDLDDDFEALEALDDDSLIAMEPGA